MIESIGFKFDMKRFEHGLEDGDRVWDYLVYEWNILRKRMFKMVNLFYLSTFPVHWTTDAYGQY